MNIKIWKFESPKILAIILLSSLLIACQTPMYTFEYATTYLEIPTPNPNNPATTTITAPPLKYEITYEGPADTSERHLRFTMDLQNTSTYKASLNLNSLKLLDDDKREIPGSIEGNYVGVQALDIYPGTSAKISLVFRFPALYDFTNVGSLQLAWIYQSNEQIFSQLSKFIRKEIEYRSVYPYDPWYSPWYSSPYLWGSVYWGVDVGLHHWGHWRYHHHRPWRRHCK